MYFDRFDICAAFSALECDYNKDGWLQERPSNQRRRESIGCQLARISYTNPFGGGGYSSLESENAQEIYLERVLRWGLPMDEDLVIAALKHFILEYLQSLRPEIFGKPVALVMNVCQSCGAHSSYRWGVCGDYHISPAGRMEFIETAGCPSHHLRAQQLKALPDHGDPDEDTD